MAYGISDEEELKIYRSFMERIAVNHDTMNEGKVIDGVDLIVAWSRSHRCGNGEYSEEYQNDIVLSVIERMEMYYKHDKPL